jgi:hypothetical protein
MTQAERITALEVQVGQLSRDVNVMNSKLDELLALRNKGAGAFWLASLLFGTTLLGVAGVIVNWMKG